MTPVAIRNPVTAAERLDPGVNRAWVGEHFVTVGRRGQEGPGPVGEDALPGSGHPSTPSLRPRPPGAGSASSSRSQPMLARAAMLTRPAILTRPGMSPRGEP
jgi:hypothetical protein